MADERVFLIAWLKPKPGNEDEMAELLGGMCAPSRGEEGCIFYNLFKATDEAGAFHFIECWKSQAALDAHREEPHYKNFRAKLPDLLAEPVGVKFLEALDSTAG